MAIAGSTGETTTGILLGWDNNTVDTLGNTILGVQAAIHCTSGSSAGSTSPSTADWSLIVTTRRGQETHTHELPLDGKRRFYRIQAVYDGYQSSTWLGVIDAKPVEIYDL